MFSTVLGFITDNLLFTAPIGGVIIALILKRINNDKIQAFVNWPFDKLAFILGSTCKGAGIFITAFFGGKFKYTKPFWNKLIEPYLIDAIENIVVTVIKGITRVVNSATNNFIEGLRSDNK